MRSRLAFWAAVVGLTLARFYHFTPFLDHPHAWRQADTAHYSLAFHQFGMNILWPSVNWLGDHRHALLEFPLPEWLAAAAYVVTGPTILVDRLVTIGFFLGSAYFLYRVAALIADATLARVAVIFYMAAPLGLYYSRAVHVDFAAIAFGHAALFFVLRGVQREDPSDFVRAAIAASGGFLVKAPYVFYLILPAVWACLRKRPPRRIWMLTGMSFLVPALVFLAWRWHVERVNALAPDLSFVPGYFALTNREGFYFGSLHQRLSLGTWATIFDRISREIGATAWLALAPLGWLDRDRLRRVAGPLGSWTVGALLYLVVFVNLNELHNYYQLPFLAVLCLWMALPVAGWFDRAGGAWRTLAVTAVLGFALSSAAVINAPNYYLVDRQAIRAGEFVAAHTRPDDLVIMAWPGTVYGDPTFLYYARRRGWAVAPARLEPLVIQGLKGHGATVVVTSSEAPPPNGTAAYLDGLETIAETSDGTSRVRLHRIR